MSPVSRFAFFIGGLIAFAAPTVQGKGIIVRFLPNPPEDSVVLYQVLRAEGRGIAPVPVGQVPAAAGKDTLAFADTSALKGRLYLYSIIGLDAAGGASDPSESTEVAQPFLALPDTLTGGSLGVRFSLALGADPMSGAAPLVLSLEDSSRFSMRYDSAAHQIVFAARGDARAGQVSVLATYFGKFTDKAAVWLSFDAPARLSRPAGVGPSQAWDLPPDWSPRLGSLRIRAAASPAATGGAAAKWTLWTARGEAVAALALPADGSEAAWDGRDGSGRPVKPACYLWAARGPGGALLRSGSLRILP